MTRQKTEFEIFEPTFEQISDPDSPFYDERWFESDLLPENHEWAETIGDFLFMCAMIKKHVYTGKNKNLAKEQQDNIERFQALVPEIEDIIKGGYDSLEFAKKWAILLRAYDASGAIEREQKIREDHGRYDRKS